MFPRIFACLTFLFCTSCVMNDEDKKSELHAVTTIKRGNSSNSTSAGGRKKSQKTSTASARSSARPVPVQTSRLSERGESASSEIKLKDVTKVDLSTVDPKNDDNDVVNSKDTTLKTVEKRIFDAMRTAGDIAQLTPLFFMGISVVRAFLNLVFVRS